MGGKGYRSLFRGVAVLLLVVAAGGASAQSWPNRPIRVIVPLAPGGTGDTLARLSGDLISSAVGQPAVIDNRSGANGVIGMEIVAAAAPDGHTLVAASSGNSSMNEALYGDRLKFSIARDFSPVVHVATTTSVVVVHPSLAAKSIPDLIALARAKPGALNYASAGVGSAVHLGNALFENMAGVRMNHVPYKGSTQGRIAVVQGEAQLMFDGLLPTIPLIKQGRLRPLAVTSPRRSTVLPEVPTVAETLPGYRAETWYAVFAPAKTPATIIKRLHAAVADGLKRPEVEQKLRAQGALPSGAGPAELAVLARQETELWRKVIREAGIKAQ